MNHESLEEALSILIEEQDMEHYPVQTLALQRIVYLLERLLARVEEVEIEN